MKKIVIFSYKGGEGRTTTVGNLAYNLSVTGKKVLIVDCDKQSNVSFLYRRSDSRFSVYDVLLRKCKINTAIYRTSYKNLDIISADSRLELYSESVATTLNDRLETIENDYDYCIIDCHPDYSMISINALAAADYLIIPMQTTSYSLRSLSDVLRQVEYIKTYNPKIKLLGVLLTMVKTGKATTIILKQTIEYCKANDLPLFENPIRYSSLVNWSTIRQKPLLKCRSKINPTRDYVAFTQAVMRGVES